MFITFEGGEGSGKTTQANLLAERLRATGQTVRVTREPGGTPLADVLRAVLLHPDETLAALRTAGLVSGNAPAEPLLPLTEAFVLSAGRAQHVEAIRRWLAAGDIVLSDRYADATRAYQGSGRGYDLPTLIELERMATGGLHPDLTLLLDLPPEEGLRRRHGAAPEDINRLDRESVTFHQRVREGYRALAAAEPDRWVVLDASQPPEALAERIWDVVSERLARRAR